MCSINLLCLIRFLSVMKIWPHPLFTQGPPTPPQNCKPASSQCAIQTIFSPATSCFRPSWAAKFKRTLSCYLYLSYPPQSKKGAKYYCSPCWAFVSFLCAFFCFIPSSVFSLSADRKYTGVWSIISASAPGSNQYQNKLLHKSKQTPSHLTRQRVNSRREEAYICFPH